MHDERTARARLRRRRALETGAAVTLVVALAACGAGPEAGWIDGSPAEADARAASGAADAPAGGYRSKVALEAAAVPGVPIADEPVGGELGTIRSPERPTAGPLRAASVDDNAAFDAFLDYRAGFLRGKVPAHDVDVSGRVLARVVSRDGAPVLGARVVVEDAAGVALAETRTDMSGTAALFPAPASAQGQQQPGGRRLVATRGQARAEAAVDADPQTLRLDVPSGPVAGLDVLFLIDATGSMDDEIARLRESMRSVARRVAETPGAPDVRFALTAFRDRGDAFVTRTFDFTSDAAAVQSALGEVVAAGGGDTPEAVNEALRDALAKPSWREGDDVVRLVFLIGDAAPHLDYPDDADYVTESRDAARRGITVHPVASSGLDEQGEYVFRQIALLTGGRFSFLTYGPDGAPEATPHHVEDYTALALDDLVVRIVREEIGQTP